MSYFLRRRFNSETKMQLQVMFLAALLAVTLSSVMAAYKSVCYFGSWSIYRPGRGKFDISQIDPNLCTHVIYSFVGITGDGNIRVLDSWADLPDGGGLNGFGKTVALRQRNPSIKIMVAVGGWSAGSETFSQVAASSTLRNRFASNVASFLQKYGFDGFDLDWEYPGQRGGKPADKKNFNELLKSLKQELNKHGKLLSTAVAAAESSARISYDIAEMSRHVDFINVMAYDFHGSWDTATGMNAPLYASPNQGGSAGQLNVNSAINYWISQGAPAKKIILGVPLYGRTFTLQNPSNHGVGAPISGPGNSGPYTQSQGMLGYNEICELFQQGGWTIRRDNTQRVPYAFKGNQWISYDDATSVSEKMNLVKSLGLGGAMVWSIETDDFGGFCGQKYPLLNTIKRGL